MGLVRSVKTSAERLAANHCNAEKSTGPRTPAGKQRASQNARRYVPWTPDFMEQMGADPRPWRRMYRQMLLEWRPAGRAEAMLVEDLANLYWAKTSLRRAQAAHKVNMDQVYGFRRERGALERRWAPPRTRDKTMLSIAGLRGIPHCPDKYGDAFTALDLMAEVTAGRAEADFDALFELLYGIHPTRQGLAVRDLYRRLTAGPKGAASPEAEQIRAKIASLIQEDRGLLREARDLEEREAAAEPVVSDPAILSPLREDWAEAEKQDADIDRRIERKLRVLVAVQRHRRRSLGDARTEASAESKASPETERP